METIMNEQNTDVRDNASDRFSSDLESLQTSFVQLREDVSKLLNHAIGTARSGAGAIKDRGSESLEEVSEKISEQPILSAVIVFGIGFVLAKLMSRH
jgi:ElaB/YqjD/DUF883 family membrane-anchored ribosome-binding protein